MLTQRWEPKSFDTSSTTFGQIGSERCFGVELEYSQVNERDGCVPKIKKLTHFGGKGDCTVSKGGEFYSPILKGDQGLKTCITLCDIAKEHKFGTSNRAGCHLHLDLRSESHDSMKAIALGYLFTKDFWQNVVPEHRRARGYTGPIRYSKQDLDSDWNDFHRGKGRYVWCNWSAYSCHTTVEIRSHEATSSGRDLVMWIKAHTRFCDAMSKLGLSSVDRVFSRKRKFSGVMREMRSIFSDPSLSGYFTRRYNKFSSAP